MCKKYATFVKHDILSVNMTEMDAVLSFFCRFLHLMCEIIACQMVLSK